MDEIFFWAYSFVRSTRNCQREPSKNTAKHLLRRLAGVRNVRAMLLGVWPGYRCGVCSYQKNYCSINTIIMNYMHVFGVIVGSYLLPLSANCMQGHPEQLYLSLCLCPCCCLYWFLCPSPCCCLCLSLQLCPSPCCSQ